MDHMITPEQCRAARGLAGLSAEQLAASAGLSHVTLKRFESGRTMQADTIEAIVAALQRAGITFIAAGQTSRGGGIGLRLASKSPDAT